MNDFKLVANMQAGKYAIGECVTDADAIAAILEGPLKKRFNKVDIHPGDVPHEPVVVTPPPAPADE